MDAVTRPDVRDLEALAEEVGARDLFVLHRLGRDAFVNLDGHGRGRGWAGNVTVDPTTEPWLARVVTLGLFRARYGYPCRIFGPYWASEAAGIAVEDRDVVIVGGRGVSEVPPPTLLRVARDASGVVSEVPVTKRLADELEITQAALSVASLRPASMEEAARGVATRAARALSCEFAAVLLAGPRPRLFLARDSWRPSASDEAVIDALVPLRDAAREGLLVEQDTGTSALARPPLGFEDGLVARCAAPLGAEGSIGVLVVAHAADAPRGFTSLCRQVIGRVADEAVPVLEPLLAR